MEKLVSAAEANRKFSELLRGVKSGQSYVVTSHGRPVARIQPVVERSRAWAKAALLARLEKQPVQDIGPWTRDELYD
ncbi:MAG: type II toxin-antitoxin system Phd/YefM family antitoxin [Candidatus Sulfotelmatobacter sp.]